MKYFQSDNKAIRTQARTTFKYIDTKWIPCPMMELEIGDIFKMFEPDGTEVLWGGHQFFEVLEKPFLNKHNVPECKVDKAIING